MDTLQMRITRECIMIYILKNREYKGNFKRYSFDGVPNWQMIDNAGILQQKQQHQQLLLLISLNQLQLIVKLMMWMQ